MLRRAQKFGDTGPYKNFDFLFNRLPAEIFFTEGFFTMFPYGNVRRITVNSFGKVRLLAQLVKRLP